MAAAAKEGCTTRRCDAERPFSRSAFLSSFLSRSLSSPTFWSLDSSLLILTYLGFSARRRPCLTCSRLRLYSHTRRTLQLVSLSIKSCNVLFCLSTILPFYPSHYCLPVTAQRASLGQLVYKTFGSHPSRSWLLIFPSPDVLPLCLRGESQVHMFSGRARKLRLHMSRTEGSQSRPGLWSLLR